MRVLFDSRAPSAVAVRGGAISHSMRPTQTHETTSFIAFAA